MFILQTLGSGKVGMADHMFDQREDEIDMMNNETFGDAALCKYKSDFYLSLIPVL